MKINKALSVISGLMLLLAIFSLPYGYYEILRCVITLSSIRLAYVKFRQNYNIAGLIMIIIGVLFNPIFPINMLKSTWVIFDLIFSIVFFAYSTGEES